MPQKTLLKKNYAENLREQIVLLREVLFKVKLYRYPPTLIKLTYLLRARLSGQNSARHGASPGTSSCAISV